MKKNVSGFLTILKPCWRVNFQLENIKAFYLFYKDTVMLVDKNVDTNIKSLSTGQTHPCPFLRCRNDFIFLAF